MNAMPLTLVVDDEPVISYVIQRMLAQHGIPTEVARGPAEALVLLESGRFGLVVCDVRMPGMSGPQMREKALQRGITLPFIFVTGDVSSLRSDALRAVSGAFVVLGKPFDHDELRTALLALFAGSQQAASTQRAS